MNYTYSTNEFIERLNDGRLRLPITSEGFAKPAENNREAFLFSTGTSCEEWTQIPVEIVEKVELLGELSCRDHSHPLVRVYFKEPPSSDSFGSAFASMLRTLISARGQTLEINPNQTTFLQKEVSWVDRRIAEEIWNKWVFPILDSDSGNPTGNWGRLKACKNLYRMCNRIYPYQNISEKDKHQACEDLKDCD